MSAAAKHTPGPWSVGRAHGNIALRDHSRIFMPGGSGAAVFSMGDSQEVTDANAKLIAAAPALLAELQRALTALGRQPFHIQTAVGYDEMRAAIAKAEGTA